MARFAYISSRYRLWARSGLPEPLREELQRAAGDVAVGT
jgi:hypothetical protein